MIQIYRNTNFLDTENLNSTGSAIDYRNGYFVNFETGRGDITTEFNVSEFLDNPVNKIMTDSFLNYIKENFSQAKIMEMKNDNKILSDSFNYFYNKVIRGVVDYNLIENLSISASSINYSKNLYYEDGSKNTTIISGQKYSNSADSYFVNIVLFQTHEILSKTPYELEADVNDGFQVQKEIIELDGAIISGQTVNKRTLILEVTPKKLIQGFVDLNIQDSPFNDYSNSGIDSDVDVFSGKTVFEITSQIFGDVTSTESVYPIGVNNVLIGDNLTFTFKTVDPLKSIDYVTVDDNNVDYDRLDNLSKQIAGKYTFSSVTDNHYISVGFI